MMSSWMAGCVLAFHHLASGAEVSNEVAFVGCQVQCEGIAEIKWKATQLEAHRVEPDRTHVWSRIAK